ncbi:MAG: DNA double-strand break repair nuclease NurA [Thermomicrobiaceae bacterium]|nr:DNA double-strand break repair nuclease NurA [Thermomicrobiaceae bacterium]
MTLDLARIVNQIGALAGEVASIQAPDRFAALDAAYAAIDPPDLRERLRTAKTSWLLARSPAEFRGAIPAPTLEGDWAVVASDGSFILPDRHSPARFYVINIGKVLLRYGDAPEADFSTDAHLYYQEDELYISRGLRRVPVNGQVLGLKRAAAELAAVADQAGKIQGRVLALQDGTLILWPLESQSDEVAEWVLEPFLETMAALREASVPVAAYISYPNSSDFVNTLRVAVCDYPSQGRPVNCDHCRSRQNHTPACDVIPDVPDRVVFEHTVRLRPGERSHVFRSSSKILERYGEDFHVHFFYLHTGTEIARVEVPKWVAEDLDLLEFTHAAIYDQCQRGRGYPPALQEAHELAAIRPDERRAVEALVEEALVRRQVVPRRSAKDGSKRGRFI